MKEDNNDIIKLLKTDPSDVLRMGKLEARKFFRALVDESNRRLEDLERSNLHISDAYLDIIGKLRSVKGKKRFTVPIDENLAKPETKIDMLYLLHSFLDNPTSKVKNAKPNQSHLNKILSAVLKDYRDRTAWDLIDYLRTEHPERFQPDDSDKIVKEIKRRIQNGESYEDVRDDIIKRWQKEHKQMLKEDEEFFKQYNKNVDWYHEQLKKWEEKHKTDYFGYNTDNGGFYEV